ncbi:hypothetical protein CYMTET_29010 [Cymbomonas tetramitiformis]|uniref:Uncharacterized protein n=1 Tax=Cymbomonas tetramitiformis TaxID=36881 RepID=A0AAE0FNB9_9CHLO|nr:hypothetical protein CYMTET_29010 [Cymbomonas tetramitiformis]
MYTCKPPDQLYTASRTSNLPYGPPGTPTRAKPLISCVLPAGGVLAERSSPRSVQSKFRMHPLLCWSCESKAGLGPGGEDLMVVGGRAQFATLGICTIPTTYFIYSPRSYACGPLRGRTVMGTIADYMDNASDGTKIFIAFLFNPLFLLVIMSVVVLFLIISRAKLAKHVREEAMLRQELKTYRQETQEKVKSSTTSRASRVAQTVKVHAEAQSL